MKRVFQIFILMGLSCLFSGCALFREDGPPPETPPFTLPSSGEKQLLTPELLVAKMVDQLSMKLVTGGMVPCFVQSVTANTGDKLEKQLLFITVSKLAATGLIRLSSSPEAPGFQTRLTPQYWQVTLKTPSTGKILLQGEISFRKE